jgi:hypothetical protein
MFLRGRLGIHLTMDHAPQLLLTDHETKLQILKHVALERLETVDTDQDPEQFTTAAIEKQTRALCKPTSSKDRP